VFLLVLTLITQTPSWHCGTPVFDAMKPAVPVPMPGGVQSPCGDSPQQTAPPRIGDTRMMWLQNMSVMPPVQFQGALTCRGTGNHCYVMVDDSSWAAGIVDSADVSHILERFDNSSPRDTNHGVWYYNTTVFGQPPDAIDNDSLVYLLYYNVGEFHGYSFDGFWQYFDEYYDTTSMRLWGYHSNEVECVYLDCSPNNPAGDYRISIAAHEFQHMIHWNYDQAESLWVNEGCSELAMWLFGVPDAISGFNTQSDNDLTIWTGSWADYIKTYLWTLFLYEQYGGRVGNDLIHNIVASPFVSIAGVDSAFAATGLPQRFEEVLDQWVLANVINDTSYLSGKYGYFGEHVPRFANAAYHTTYPVSRTGGLDRWAGEYILFQKGRDLEIGFDGADGANFHAFMVAKDTIGHRLLLDTMDLDSLQAGSISAPGSDTGYQSVWLVPTSHYPYGRMNYAYTASAVGISEPNRQSPLALRPSLSGPTVVRAGTRLRLTTEAALYSTDGRLVNQESLEPGVYWLAAAGQRRKLVVIR